MTIPSDEFTQIYNDNYNFLLRIAKNIVGDLSRANDIVHDSMLKLYKHKDYPSIKDGVRPWLCVTCKTTALKVIKKDKRLVFQESPGDLELAEHSSPLESILNIEDKTENKKMLAGALATLKPREREIIKLRYNKKMKYKEIAKTLGISEGNVGFIISVTMSYLKGKLQAKPKKLKSKKL